MDNIRDINTESSQKTEPLRSFVRHLGIDLIGIANLRTLEGMPLGIPTDLASFLGRFQLTIIPTVEKMC
jgi:hypothetical protein